MKPGEVDLWAHGFVALPRLAADLVAEPMALAVMVIILRRARHEAGPVMTDRGALDLQLGQCVVGRDELARLLKTTPAKVRTALARLVTCQIIATETTSRGTVVSLVNPARYVGRAEVESPADSPTSRQQTASKSPAGRQQIATKDHLPRDSEDQETARPDPVAEAGDALPLKPKTNGIEVKAQALAIAAAEAFTGIGRRTDQTSKNLRKLCRALARDGATPDQVREVIAAKAAEWTDTTMARYVQPSTLLAAKNYAKYLEEDVPRWKAARANGTPTNGKPVRDVRRGHYAPAEDAVFRDGAVNLDELEQEEARHVGV